MFISVASYLAHFETEAFATWKWPIFSLAFCILINKDRHEILSSTALVVGTDTISLLLTYLPLQIYRRKLISIVCLPPLACNC